MFCVPLALAASVSRCLFGVPLSSSFMSAAPYLTPQSDTMPGNLARLKKKQKNKDEFECLRRGNVVIAAEENGAGKWGRCHR